MKHLLTIIAITVSIMVIAAITTVNWKDKTLSLAAISKEDTANEISAIADTALVCQERTVDKEEPAEEGWWINTVMYAKGHSFGYSGDISMWGGWYFDTIYLGDDNMLKYKTVGPSTLQLSLVTRELTVDLGDPKAVNKIKNFLNPIDGFKRLNKRYEECLDSLYYDGYDYGEYLGSFSFEVDYADSRMTNAEMINRFICEVTAQSENEKSEVSKLSSFYAGFNPTIIYRRAYSGNTNDMLELSEFLAHRTFENWKRIGDFGMGSNDATLAVRPLIVNKKYITFSKYEYDREGTGHGMYTETFHTFDLKSGKKLKNKDVFQPQSLDKVKMKLFEVMAKDPHYLAWNSSTASPSEIEDRIKAWKSPSPAIEGTEWEEPERDFKFELPDGALTESGIIFSFQPYEIDCWAAGAYHFIVPYKKLMPYLTPTAKRLISNINSK